MNNIFLVKGQRRGMDALMSEWVVASYEDKSEAIEHCYLAAQQRHKSYLKEPHEEGATIPLDKHAIWSGFIVDYRIEEVPMILHVDQYMGEIFPEGMG